MRFKVRRANIDQEVRTLFEQYGEQVVALALGLGTMQGSGGLGSAPVMLTRAMMVVFQNQDAAHKWLMERHDVAERRETLNFFVEVAILGFVVVAVPDHRPVAAPSLRITGFFEQSGLCLAIVGHPQPFEAAAVRFFWDAGDIVDADELLSTLTPISEFTVNQAAAYIADIVDIIANGVPFPYVRLFLLKPGHTRDRQHFAVDIQPPNSTAALDQIPSPRSQLQSHFLST
jgi:hypothetical protein